MNIYYTERHIATLFFAEFLGLLAYQLKDCNNGQDKEKEETPMTGSRNVTEQLIVYHTFHMQKFVTRPCYKN